MAIAFIVSAPSGIRRRDHRLEREGRRVRDAADGPARRPESRGDRSGRDVRRGQLDRAPLPTLSDSACRRPRRASKEAAAAAAAGTASGGPPSAGASEELKGALAAYLAAIPDGDAKSEGIQLGEAVAAKVLEARAKDGSDAPDSYRPKTKPGVYVPTADHGRLDVAEREAVRHDEPIAVPPGASDPAQERAVGRRLQRDQEPRRKGQRQAFRHGRPRTPASGSSPARSPPTRSRANWWWRRR